VEVVTAAELAGVVTFAISGVLAVSVRLDWFGVVVVGIVTALGGGTIRDVILDDTPVVWVEDLGYLAAAAAGAALATPLARWLATGSRRRFEEALQVADAAGLALFVVVGAQIALDVGFGAGVAIVSAVVTGIGGGLIRDVLAARTPMVLAGEFYATAALGGAIVYVTLDRAASVPELPAAVAGALTVFVLRVLGIRRRWTVPAITR